jgi:hypothetical protein
MNWLAAAMVMTSCGVDVWALSPSQRAAVPRKCFPSPLRCYSNSYSHYSSFESKLVNLSIVMKLAVPHFLVHNPGCSSPSPLAKSRHQQIPADVQ